MSKSIIYVCLHSLKFDTCNLHRITISNDNVIYQSRCRRESKYPRIALDRPYMYDAAGAFIVALT